jgi:AbrB family looped-hinge helix DNA binding protein
MPKVTSKLQVTVPKRIADRYRIEPGQELEWLEAGDAIRVVPASSLTARTSKAERRVAFFDAATDRQRQREDERPIRPSAADRGWTREELYGRGDAG